MKYSIFLNGERGLYILKKLLKLKTYKLNNVICCRNEIRKKLKKIISSKKIDLIRDINSDENFIRLKSLNDDLFIIAGYPQIFSKKIYSIPKKMTINLHAGPIPQYRGGSPLNWQIINQEKKIGIAILKVNERIDGGKLIEKSNFNLKKEDDIRSVHAKANRLFFIILKKALLKIKKHKLENIFLKKIGKSKYWNQRRDHHGLLDYKKKTASECYDFIRAVTKPYPGAWIRHKTKNKMGIIRLYKSKIINEKTALKSNSLYLTCKDSLLEITDFKILNEKKFSKRKSKICKIKVKYVKRDKLMPKRGTLLLIDPWLSRKLNKKAYFLNEKFISKFLKYEKIKKDQFIYTKIKNKNFSNILKKKLFRFITTNIQSKKKIAHLYDYDQNCTWAIKKDLKYLKVISKKSYKLSRFHLDKRIAKHTCDTIFTSWIENYFKNQRGDYLLVYRKMRKPLGFLLLTKDEKKYLRIDLIAVSNQFKRLNIGTKLIDYAMFLFNKYYSHLIVGYQSHNLAALNFYKKIGFKIESKKDIYHYNEKN